MDRPAGVVPEPSVPPVDPPAPLELPRGEVHVWQASLDRPGDAAMLSSDERARADRLRRERERARFVRSRTLLRRVLAAYSGIAPEDLRFGEGRGGKPFLAGDAASSLRFNLSHAESLWALAVARDRDVGIDVERADRAVDVEAVARRLFPPGEIAALRRLEGPAREAAFFRSWAGREAVVKGLGTGMFASGREFEVAGDPALPLTVLPTGPGPVHRWRLAEMRVPEGFVGALATEGRPTAIRSWGLDV